MGSCSTVRFFIFAAFFPCKLYQYLLICTCKAKERTCMQGTTVREELPIRMPAVILRYAGGFDSRNTYRKCTCGKEKNHPTPLQCGTRAAKMRFAKIPQCQNSPVETAYLYERPKCQRLSSLAFCKPMQHHLAAVSMQQRVASQPHQRRKE